MLFHRSNLIIHKMANQDPEQQNTHCLYFAEDGSTVASNRISAIACSPVDRRQYFPDIGKKPIDLEYGTAVHLDVVEQVLKNIPKTKDSFMQYAVITRMDNERIELTTTDKQKELSVTGKVLRISFPDWKALFRISFDYVKTFFNNCSSLLTRKQINENENYGRIAVNRKMLIQLLQTIDDACGNQNEDLIYIEFSSDKNPLLLRAQNRLTGQKVISIIRPVFLAEQWMKYDEWESSVFNLLNTENEKNTENSIPLKKKIPLKRKE